MYSKTIILKKIFYYNKSYINKIRVCNVKLLLRLINAVVNVKFFKLITSHDFYYLMHKKSNTISKYLHNLIILGIYPYLLYY